jgi:hypothetical protein
MGVASHGGGLLRFAADRRSLAVLAIHFTLQAVAFGWHPPSNLARAALIAGLCLTAFLCTVVLHNVLHCPVFHSRALNRMLQVALSLVVGYPASGFVSSHNLGHHRHLQSSKDTLRTTELRLPLNVLNFLVYPVLAEVHTSRTYLRYLGVMKRKSPRWFSQVRVEMLSAFVFLGSLGVVDWRRMLLYVGIPSLYAIAAPLEHLSALREEDPVHLDLLGARESRLGRVLEATDRQDRVVRLRGPVVHPALFVDRESRVAELLHVLALRVTQGQAGRVLHAVVVDESPHRGAPPASDVEHAPHLGRPRLRDVVVELADLRRVEIVAALVERASVRERFVQPQTVERIPDVVVRLDGLGGRSPLRHPRSRRDRPRSDIRQT